MSEMYVECLVKSQASMLAKFARIVLMMLTIAFGLLALLGFLPALIIAVITGVGAYFIWLHSDIEYEYLYLDKELTIDKVMAKTKRKRVATFEIERMEILATFRSYQLSNYNNRNIKADDYSIKIEEQPDLRYVMYYEGNKKIILSPSAELVKAIKTIAPRKVFTD